jgi:hypothetical protein
VPDPPIIFDFVRQIGGSDGRRCFVITTARHGAIAAKDAVEPNLSGNETRAATDDHRHPLSRMSAAALTSFHVPISEKTAAETTRVIRTW